MLKLDISIEEIGIYKIGDGSNTPLSEFKEFTPYRGLEPYGARCGCGGACGCGCSGCAGSCSDCQKCRGSLNLERELTKLA